MQETTSFYWNSRIKMMSPKIVLLLVAILCSIIILLLIPQINAQHHGAPPPSANIGNRKVTLNMQTEPKIIKAGQNFLMKIAFVDENVKQNINHVTFRMDISKDGKHVLSDFFHGHGGEIQLAFRHTNAISPSIGGTMDVLTNAWIADPGSPITVTGNTFSQPGIYRTAIEVTTIDNDKTDLPEPVKYEFSIPIS